MNILVTGASKGIGNAIAKELQSIGEVFVTGRNEQALTACNAKGFCVCDLSKDINTLAQYIIDNKIDVLVNNAGEYIYGGLETLATTDIQRIFQTNLIAPTYLISKAIPYMKSQKWGRIINIGSISGVMGEAYASVYSSSKAGLIGLTNSIEDSEFSKDEILQCIPQKRFVKPEEIAKLCKYLISQDAKGITGQSINLCAGLSVGI